MVDYYLRDPKRVYKVPQAKRPFGIDWADDLGDDTITGSTWTVITAGITISSNPAPSFTASTTTLYVEGGTITSGEEYTDYDIANDVTLASGGNDRRILTVRVKNK